MNAGGSYYVGINDNVTVSQRSSITGVCLTKQKYNLLKDLCAKHTKIYLLERLYFQFVYALSPWQFLVCNKYNNRSQLVANSYHNPIYKPHEKKI